jgi:hypothetical protein
LPEHHDVVVVRLLGERDFDVVGRPVVHRVEELRVHRHRNVDQAAAALHHHFALDLALEQEVVLVAPGAADRQRPGQGTGEPQAVGGEQIGRGLQQSLVGHFVVGPGGLAQQCREVEARVPPSDHPVKV